MSHESITNLPEILLQLVDRYQKPDAMLYKKGGKFHSVSTEQFYRIVEQIAAGLLAIGINKNDKICVSSENRPEWVFADMAIMSIGAINVPLFPDFSESQMRYILNDSECKIAFVSKKEALPKIAKIAKDTALQKIYSIDPSPIDGIVSFDNLINEGKVLIEKTQFSLHEQIKTIHGDEIATIVYTSGTTGEPKGVMLTHKNILSNVKSVINIIPFDAQDTSLSFLPLSHIFERTAGYYCLLYKGATVAYAESLNKLPDNLKEIKPTLLIAVPRFYEKFHDMIISAINKAPFYKKRLFQWAVNTSKKAAFCRSQKKKIPVPLAVNFSLAQRLVLQKISTHLGGRLRILISGGAPLPKETAQFFYDLNILILEGYGLTESSPVLSLNTPSEFKFGTVGKPIAGVKVKIADDGEILAQGENIMQGYFKKTVETNAALRTGWLYTGDFGNIDANGFLSITDRKKDLIVSAAGKKISPQAIENAMKMSKYINEAVVIGDNQKYLCALIVPHFEKCFSYAKNQNYSFSSREELCESLLIHDLIKHELDEISSLFSPCEKIKKFALIKEEFKVANEELTPTLKVRRKLVQQKYQSLINSLFTE